MKYSRRSFLNTVGAGAALLPLLPSARARAAGGPKRLVIVTFPNGIHPPEFWPTGGETDFAFKQILSPMEPFKKDLLILGGLDVSCFIGQLRPADNRVSDAGWGHDDFLALLTGARYAHYPLYANVKVGNDSIDQTIADGIAQKTKLPFHSLQIGARTDSGYNNCISARKGGEGITPENDPVRLWKKMFEGRSLPKEELDKLLAERRSVLDYLGPEVERFGKRLGKDDRVHIESHLSSLRDLEKELAVSTTPAVACSAPAQPSGTDFRAKENYPKLLKVQMDLIFMALRCDLTRVITWVCTNTGGSDVVYSWLGAEYTGAGDEYPIRNCHDIAHQQGRSAAHLQRYIGVKKWYYQQYTHLLEQMKSVREGDGTMLDNSAVVITNTTGSNHMATGLPWMIAGGCGGYFKTGRLLKYGGWAGKSGEYWKNRGIGHNPLLTSLANAMDVPMGQFGDPQFGTGELPGLRG